jgi:hypothetical protein
MKRILLLSVFVVLVACTSRRPPMSEFATSVGRDCGKKCLRGHTRCMDAACPAKATSSCGPKCDLKLRECYEACLEADSGPEDLPPAEPVR